MRVLLLTVAMAQAAVAPIPAQAQTMRDRFSDWHMGEWGWGHMMAGGIGMLLFWVAVFVLIFLLVRSLTGAAVRQAPRSSAVELLEERYARGEIDRQEYEERRQVLRGGRKD